MDGKHSYQRTGLLGSLLCSILVPVAMSSVACNQPPPHDVDMTASTAPPAASPTTTAPPPKPASAATHETMPPPTKVQPLTTNPDREIGKYTVRKGDTYWGIAVRVLGDGRRWREISDLNAAVKPSQLKPGMVIRVPSR